MNATESCSICGGTLRVTIECPRCGNKLHDRIGQPHQCPRWWMAPDVQRDLTGHDLLDIFDRTADRPKLRAKIRTHLDLDHNPRPAADDADGRPVIPASIERD